MMHLDVTPPTADEERELGRRIRAGDRAARNELVERNMPLVFRIAAGVRGDNSDAIQEGAMGLLRAADMFDPDRGFRFTTYASRWIVAFMMRGVDRDPLVHVPAHVKVLIRRDERRDAAEGKPTEPEKVRAMKMRARVAMSGAWSMSRRHDDGDAIGDAVPARESGTPEPDEIEAVMHAVGRLAPREAEIIRRRIWGDETLKEIGLQLGITREYVQQIEARAFDKLREMLA
jgi:RNA polymerase sigma factor (sigma-70 family)